MAGKACALTCCELNGRMVISINTMAADLASLRMREAFFTSVLKRLPLLNRFSTSPMVSRKYPKYVTIVPHLSWLTDSIVPRSSLS